MVWRVMKRRLVNGLLSVKKVIKIVDMIGCTGGAQPEQKST